MCAFECVTVNHIYNSVCACRPKHINSSVSAPLNATKIAVMKGIDWQIRMVGSALLFSVYKFKKKKNLIGTSKYILRIGITSMFLHNWWTSFREQNDDLHVQQYKDTVYN